MPDTEIFDLIAANRLITADLLATLTPAQWETQSLCSSWTIRQLAGHMVMPFTITARQMIIGIIKERGSFDRFSEKASKRIGLQPPEKLIATLRANATSRFTPPGLGPLAPLTDTSIHLRDVAIPLGLDTTPPLGTWKRVLDFVVSPSSKRGFVPPSRITGLAFSATDQEWLAGSGATVTGPSESLALAIAGRAAGLETLRGPGVEILRTRIG